MYSTFCLSARSYRADFAELQQQVEVQLIVLGVVYTSFNSYAVTVSSMHGNGVYLAPTAGNIDIRCLNTENLALSLSRPTLPLTQSITFVR